MSEWHNHDVLGRKRRAARMSMKEAHAIMVERRAALVRDYATMTRAEAAQKKDRRNHHEREPSEIPPVFIGLLLGLMFGALVLMAGPHP